MCPDKNGVAVLCEECRHALRLPKKTDTWAYSSSYHVSKRILYRQPNLPSESNCSFCQILGDVLTKELKLLPDDVASKSLYLNMEWITDRRFLSENLDDTAIGWLLRVMIYSDSAEVKDFSFPTSSRSKVLVTSYNFPPPIESSALEAGGIEFIKTSLDNCAGHMHSNIETPEFLPTRLIDVRRDILQVVELNKSLGQPLQSTDRRYLTLSYCWGGQSQLLLTRSNEQRLKTGFSLEELSPTQRETIALAKAISIPYVWIDALCIVQGDAEDWASEAAAMGNVYSGAYLTVCTASSTSCQEGYLDRKSVLPITVPADPVSDPSGATGTYVFQPIMWSSRPGKYNTGNWGQYRLEHTQWSSRAWTFQEMMMSTRLIYFTTSGMHFNCGQYIKSEFSYYLAQPLFTAHLYPSTFDHFGLAGLDQADDTAEIYEAWFRYVVMRYGNRKMSEPTDAFPSLSGLAQAFASPLKDDYVAGLWRQTLAFGLSWETSDYSHDTLETLLSSYSNPSPYVSPSWSWVAHGRVDYRHIDHFDEITNACEKLEATCVLDGADKCGRLVSASLVVRTRVYPFSLGCFYNINLGEYQLRRKGGPSIFISFDFRCYEYEAIGDVWKDFILLLIGQYKQQPVGLVAYPANDDGTNNDNGRK